jgi:hypothetical protein
MGQRSTTSINTACPDGHELASLLHRGGFEERFLEEVCMQNRVRSLILAVAVAVIGCGDADTEELEKGPPVMDPNNPPAGGPICVCPGFFMRPFGSCPKAPEDGAIQANLNCAANGGCIFQVTTSNSLALLLDHRDVFVPKTQPGFPFAEVFQTQANDPPGGLVTVTATDQNTGTSFTLGQVLVSNSCP